jgi:hypothetical protein
MCALPDKDAIAAQETLVAALANPACYPHPVERMRVIETHISHVLLTGRYAYKSRNPWISAFSISALWSGVASTARRSCA